MDLTSIVPICLAVLGGIGTVAWWFLRSLRVDIDNHTREISERAKSDDLETVKQGLADFKVECAKNFITQPALMQVMTSLDRTIQQLTTAITNNSEESRTGMAALNKRIDDMMSRQTWRE